MQFPSPGLLPDQLPDLEQLFQQAPAALCLLTGPDLLYARVNTAYQQLFPDRLLLGRPWREVFPELVAHPVHEALQRVYRTGHPHVDQNVLLDVARTASEPPADCYVDYVFQAYHDPSGRPTGVLVFVYDVTQQVVARREVLMLNTQLSKLSEELAHGVVARRQALNASNVAVQDARDDARQQRARLTGFFKQTQAAICILSGAAHVLDYCNPAYQRLFPGRELSARPVAEVHPNAGAQGLLTLLDEVYRTGRPYAGHEVAVTLDQAGKQGPRIMHFTFTCEAYREDGRIAGITVLAYDVSEYVAARGQVQALHLERDRTSQQLNRSTTDLDTFIYTASHDLRTPVTNLEGLLAALREQLPPEALQADLVQPLLDRMQNSVEQFQLTIAQLTDVAQLQQARDQPSETVDLADLVADLRPDLAPLLAIAGTQLTVDVTTCPHVSFEPKNLRSIVYNLLSNALKYRHPARPPVVVLRCRSTADAVVLEVQDNGLGLTESQQGQLFGLFQRLHDHVAGTGIGLYMVKRFVENAGGTITVQSQVGEGTTFTIALPGASSSTSPAGCQS